MAINDRLSIAIEEQFPDFVKEEGPNLIAFMKAYFEWMETSDQVLDVNKTLLTNQDLDDTLPKFLKYFQNELMQDLPDAVLTDKRLLMKNIRDLYTSKGGQKSYELLFRILYNEDLEFYYPGQDILRASDGRWLKDSILNVITLTGLIDDFVSREVTGQTSGATATVESVSTTVSSGIDVTQLTITSQVGTFVDQEIVTTVDGNRAEVFSTIGPLNDVTITRGGKGHSVGDRASFLSPSGLGALGTITAVTDTSGVTVNILNGGSGYQANAIISITGGSGTGAAAEIGSLSNTSVLPINKDTIQPMANVVLNTGPKFISLGANTSAVSANLANANVSSQIIAGLNFVNTTVGTIASVITTDFGFGYFPNRPSVSVIDTEVQRMNLADTLAGESPDIQGSDALLTTAYVTGAISDVEVGATTLGTGYRKFDNVTIRNLTTSSGVVDGRGTPVITGVIDQPGRYTDTKGFISGNNKLQDNFYYQEYSYVLQSTQFINTYRDIVNKILHPAGTKLFGEVDIDSQLIVTPNSTFANGTFANTTHSAITKSEGLGLGDSFDDGSARFDSLGITFDTI